MMQEEELFGCVVNSEMVQMAVLRGDYKTPEQALDFADEAKKAREIALKFAVRNARNVQICEEVCKITKREDPIYRLAVKKKLSLWQEQISDCKSSDEALEIAKAAKNDKTLRTSAFYKAQELETSFEKLRLIIKLYKCHDDLEVILWEKAFKLSTMLIHYSYIVNVMPDQPKLEKLRSQAREMQDKVLDEDMEKADDYDKLAELYFKPEYKDVKNDIYLEFNNRFDEQLRSTKSYESAEELFIVLDRYGKSLIEVKKHKPKVLKLLLKYADSFDSALLVYDNAKDGSTIKLLALEKMQKFANSNSERRAVESAPEYSTLEQKLTSPSAKVMRQYLRLM